MRTVEWDKCVLFVLWGFVAVTVLHPPLGPKPMVGLLYSSVYLAALWWEHQADVHRRPSGGAVISKWRRLWVTEDCREKACVETGFWGKMSFEWKRCFCGFVWILTNWCLEKDLFVVSFCFATKELWRLFGNWFYRNCVKSTGCVKTRLNSLQICQVKHFPCAEILLRGREAWLLLHLISFYSRFCLCIPAKDEKYVKALNDFFFLSSEDRKMCIAGVPLSRAGRQQWLWACQARVHGKWDWVRI